MQIDDKQQSANLVYTLDEAARKLGFSRKTLQREINAGRYPESFRVGKRSCTSARDIEQYQRQLQSTKDAATVAKEREQANRIEFQRRIRGHLLELRKIPFGGQLGPRGEDGQPLVRSFDSSDPNRLP